MKRFNNILFYTDRKGDVQTALTHAISIAKYNKARLTVIDVITEKLDYYSQLMSVYKHTMHLRDMVFQDRLTELRNLVAPIKAEGVDIHTKVFVGTPFLEIIREVLRRKHDLLIATAEGKDEFKSMLLGTTTMHLIRKCPCTVLTVKAGTKPKFKRILAAVDPDPENKEKTKLNNKIMDLASSLASIHESELHVIHTWSFPDISAEIPENLRKEIKQDIQRLHESRYEEFLDQYTSGLTDTKVHCLEGNPAAAIPRVVREKTIDLIVLGTISRTGIAGLLIGNTAEKVLYRVDCSILAVKPDNFRSPVHL